MYSSAPPKTRILNTKKMNIPLVSYNFKVLITNLAHPLERARVQIVIEALVDQALGYALAKTINKGQL